MNSENNAIITIASSCVEYNKNVGKITLRHFGNLSKEERGIIFTILVGAGTFLVMTKKV